MSEVDTPVVSVIIASRDRGTLLAETLDALGRQTWPTDRVEILVADNGSSDNTRAVVAEAASRPGAPAVRYLSVLTPGKSFAVNAALTFARGAILAFTDDDVLPEPEWIERLVAVFSETGAAFVAGRILPRWETPPPAWLSPPLYGVLAIPDNGQRRRTISSASDGVMPIGANMAVRADVIARVGGLRTDLGKLDGTLRTGEDHEFFLRMLAAGFSGVYEPSAVVHHWVPRERLVRGYFRRWMFQNGRDVARLEEPGGHALPRLLGVPRYLWREAAIHAGQAIRRRPAGSASAFAASLRVVWFGGYLRERWGARKQSPRRARRVPCTPSTHQFAVRPTPHTKNLARASAC